MNYSAFLNSRDYSSFFFKKSLFNQVFSCWNFDQFLFLDLFQPKKIPHGNIIFTFGGNHHRAGFCAFCAETTCTGLTRHPYEVPSFEETPELLLLGELRRHLFLLKRAIEAIAPRKGWDGMIVFWSNFGWSHLGGLVCVFFLLGGDPDGEYYLKEYILYIYICIY